MCNIGNSNRIGVGQSSSPFQAQLAIGSNSLGVSGVIMFTLIV